MAVSNDTTWHDAEGAIRDILFLYRDLTFYNGFSGDHPTGDFKPWRWLAWTPDAGWATLDDVQLLQEGSAVALIVQLIDAWDQAGGSGIQTYEGALRSRRFDPLPTARAAIASGVMGTETDDFDQKASAVYDEYVLALFSRLADARPAM